MPVLMNCGCGYTIPQHVLSLINQYQVDSEQTHTESLDCRLTLKRLTVSGNGSSLQVNAQLWPCKQFQLYRLARMCQKL
jgi:hypothetical protein